MKPTHRQCQWRGLARPRAARCVREIVPGAVRRSVFFRTRSYVGSGYAALRNSAPLVTLNAALQAFLDSALTPDITRRLDAGQAVVDALDALRDEDIQNGALLQSVKVQLCTWLSGYRPQALEAVRNGIEALLGADEESLRAPWWRRVSVRRAAMQKRTVAVPGFHRRIALAHMFRATQAMMALRIAQRSQTVDARKTLLQRRLRHIEMRANVFRSVGMHAMVHLDTILADVTTRRIPFAQSFSDIIIAGCANPRCLPIRRQVDGWYLQRAISRDDVFTLWQRAHALSGRAQRIQTLLIRLSDRTRRLEREQASAWDVFARRW